MLPAAHKIIILALLATSPGIAFAYIDPGTGSILIQGIIAAIAAIGVTLKLYWHRFVKFFKRGKKEHVAERTGEGDQGRYQDTPGQEGS